MASAASVPLEAAFAPLMIGEHGGSERYDWRWRHATALDTGFSLLAGRFRTELAVFLSDPEVERTRFPGTVPPDRSRHGPGPRRTQNTPAHPRRAGRNPHRPLLAAAGARVSHAAGDAAGPAGLPPRRPLPRRGPVRSRFRGRARHGRCPLHPRAADPVVARAGPPRLRHRLPPSVRPRGGLRRLL